MIKKVVITIDEGNIETYYNSLQVFKKNNLKQRFLLLEIE